MTDHSSQTTDERVERALRELQGAQPASDLSARIVASLPTQSVSTNAHPLLGAATLGAALLGLALAYQTAFTLRVNGAFELVAYYTAQPEIVVMYPDQAWSALAAAIPWLTMLFGFVVLGMALLLAVRWTGAARVRGVG